MNEDSYFRPFLHCLIKKSKYNPLDGTFEFEVVRDEKVHKISFLNIKPFVYFNNTKSALERYRYREISSVVFKDEKATFSRIAPKWVAEQAHNFNVSIEAVRKTVLLKCDKMRIDNRIYSLKA